MRVFVTGGTGLLGSHLAEELRSYGQDVVALNRCGSDAAFLRSQGCTLVQGDVRDDIESLAELMAGCTHLVHSAAIVYGGKSWPKVRAVNVDGTRNVLMAAVRAGINFAVHVSSVVVYGIVDGNVTEDTPLDGRIHDGDLYARSKRQAEVVAREIEEKHGLPVAVVRPCGVYGERDRLTALTVAKFLRLPIVPLLGSGRNTIPVVYSGNVARALRLVLESARGGTTYDVGFDLPLSQRAMLEDLASGLGKRPRFLATPASLIRRGARVLDRVGAFIPGVEHLSISRVAEFALGENPYVSKRLREELGWDPPYRHKDALMRTGRWLTKHT